MQKRFVYAYGVNLIYVLKNILDQNFWTGVNLKIPIRTVRPYMQHQRLIARHLTTPKNSSSPGKLFGKINEKNLFIHFNYLYFSYHLLARRYDAFHYR